MQLSPYTQYYVRKLLRRSVHNLDYPLNGIGISSYIQLSVEQLLRRNYAKGFVLSAKTRELETLIQRHQSNGINQPYPSGNLFEIEHQILDILGLKCLAMLSTLALKVVPETAAALFHFLLANQMQQGIRYEDDLYGLVREFGEEQDFATQRLLQKLRNQQIPFLLTASESRHGIWISLRSPVYYQLCQLDQAQLEKIA